MPNDLETMGSIMNVGKILISEELLLKLLDYYPEGKIVNIYKGERFGKVEIVICHPDMPEILEGDMIGLVCPTYTEQCDSIGRKVVFREKPDAK